MNSCETNLNLNLNNAIISSTLQLTGIVTMWGSLNYINQYHTHDIYIDLFGYEFSFNPKNMVYSFTTLLSCSCMINNLLLLNKYKYKYK